MDVLIATHGRPELLEKTLRSVLAADESMLIRRIVIVENGGDFGAAAVIASIAEKDRIELVRVPEANKSMALNAGIARCNDNLIFMTDDDVTISPGTFDGYQRASAVHGPGHFFGGAVQVLCDTRPPAWLEAYLPFSVTGLSSAQNAARKEPLFLGANWAAFKSDILAVGGFNPNFGPGSATGATGQEKEMQRRLRSRGTKGVWVPQASVAHIVPPERCTSDWVARRAYRTGIQQGIIEALEDPVKASEACGSRTWLATLRRLTRIVVAGKQRRFRQHYRQQFRAGYRYGVKVVSSGQLIPAPFLNCEASRAGTMALPAQHDGSRGQ